MSVFNQGFCLLNIAHVDRCPRHPEAAFRILGCFPSAAEAGRTAQRFGECDMVLVPMQKWVCLMREANQQDKEPENLTRLEALHARRKAEATQSFRIEGDARYRPSSFALQCHAKINENGDEFAESARVQPVPRECEQRMQNFAVISLYEDWERPRTEAEPALICWAICGTETEARAHIEENLGRRITDVHLWVVAMYEWLHVPVLGEHNNVTESFRDSVQESLVVGATRSTQKAKDFCQQCADLGIALQVTDLNNINEGISLEDKGSSQHATVEAGSEGVSQTLLTS
jgi:hypothetical protein